MKFEGASAVEKDKILEAKKEIYEKALRKAESFVRDIDPRLDVEISGIQEPHLRFRHDSWNAKVDNGWIMFLPNSVDEKYLAGDFENSVRQSYDMWMKKYAPGMVIKEKE